MDSQNLNWIQDCSREDFIQLIHKTDKRQRLGLYAKRCRNDIELFARLALRQHFRLPFASFHQKLFDWHTRMAETPLPGRPGIRFALAAPRGSAKSTIVSFLLTLHDIVYSRESYIILVSATQRQAQQRLKALRSELAASAPLLQLFPHRFRGKELLSSARHLEIGDIRIEAFGAGTEMRGISFNSWRPTKIILDDAESSAAAESTRRRLRLHDWFQEVIEHLGHGYTHILAIGTVLHDDGLLARLLARPDFESIVCRSIESFAAPSPLWNEWRRILTDPTVPDRRENARRYFLQNSTQMQHGARVLWPELEDYEQLSVQLVTQGRRAFYQEKQNQPLGPEEALFEPEQAWRARRTAAGIEIFPPPSATARQNPVRTYRTADMRLFGYHDAALGKTRAQGRGDFAALATVALAPDGFLILLDLWVRRAPPSQQVAAIFDLHSANPFEQLAIEGTGFQELLLMPIEEERQRRQSQKLRHDLPVQTIKPTRKKESRIAALEPLITSGRLALAENLPEEFWQELTNFPRTEHDDALDAAAGAVELALNNSAKPASPQKSIIARRAPRGAF